MKRCCACPFLHVNGCACPFLHVNASIDDADDSVVDANVFHSFGVIPANCYHSNSKIATTAVAWKGFNASLRMRISSKCFRNSMRMAMAQSNGVSDGVDEWRGSGGR